MSEASLTAELCRPLGVGVDFCHVSLWPNLGPRGRYIYSRASRTPRKGSQSGLSPASPEHPKISKTLFSLF